VVLRSGVTVKPCLRKDELRYTLVLAPQHSNLAPALQAGVMRQSNEMYFLHGDVLIQEARDKIFTVFETRL
jgi:hypothetical protein